MVKNNYYVINLNKLNKKLLNIIPINTLIINKFNTLYNKKVTILLMH